MTGKRCTSGSDVADDVRHALPPKRLVTLISGTGSNLQAILDALDAGRLNAEMACVISNRVDAAGLERARAAGVAVALAADDAALRRTLDELAPDVIALAGFMRILDRDLVRRFSGRIFNIHPALLPKYKGLHTHRRVLASGDAVHGCSVHFVTAALDAGPVVMQARVPVRDGDTPETVAARVLKREHLIYPRVLAWYCEGRLQLRAGRCVLDGDTLEQPLLLEAHGA